MKKTHKRILFISLMILFALLTGCQCEEHVLGEWTTKTESSCTTHGKEMRKCTECRYSEERELPLTAHPYGEWTTEIPSTCHTNGSEIRTCSYCQLLDRRDLPLLDHNYGEWREINAATYTSAGREQADCQECGAQTFRDIPMKEPVIVELTKENIKDYFEISSWISNYYEKDGRFFTFGYATANVSCKQIVNGDPKNVKISIYFSTKGGVWPAEGYGSFSITIPETEKKASKSKQISVCSTDSSEIVCPSIYISITNVEGTIVLYP